MIRGLKNVSDCMCCETKETEELPGELEIRAEQDRTSMIKNFEVEEIVCMPFAGLRK